MIDKDDPERKARRSGTARDATADAAAAGERSPGLGRLAELFERSPVALTLADTTLPDAPLVLANAAFLDLTGYGRDEVAGRNCRFLQADLPNDEARAETRQVLASGGQGQVVFRNRRKDGEAFDNLLFLQALVDRGGGSRYFLGSQFPLDRSVTERRIDAHIAQIDAAVARAVEAQETLRAEQRRMFANAAHAVANAWLALR
ncbi:MAG: PAS domain-containing protein [Paracoccaceae bacterium]|jgi:PAS domain S-box-containing protein|nr:PAS domain-containing protein [Paracoccaceae bacterium]